MSYCGPRPGLCGKKLDCADHLCPGHPLSGIVDEPLTTPDAEGDRLVRVLRYALLAFCAIGMGVASYFR